MTISLPDLPYPNTALQPHISAQTLDIHHGKHHRRYVEVLNDLIKDTPLATKSLEEIIHATVNDASKQGIFNNAAQVWNHTFFWHSLTPNGGGNPTGALEAAMISSFGSLDAFKQEFTQAAVTQFGSGWAWLVLEKGQLKITKTSNAATPFTQGQVPLLTCDVWEHAYYLDYQNRRPDFVAAFLENLVNWEFAAQNYAAGLGVTDRI
jgi:Fe-Mn family superoxide dismutase